MLWWFALPGDSGLSVFLDGHEVDSAEKSGIWESRNIFLCGCPKCLSSVACWGRGELELYEIVGLRLMCSDLAVSWFADAANKRKRHALKSSTITEQMVTPHFGSSKTQIHICHSKGLQWSIFGSVLRRRLSHRGGDFSFAAAWFWSYRFVRTKPLAFRAASGSASAALRLPGTSVMGASEAVAVLLTCQKELFWGNQAKHCK